MNIMELAKNADKIRVDVSIAGLKEFALSICEMYDKQKENERKQSEGTMSQKEAAKYLGNKASAQYPYFSFNI